MEKAMSGRVKPPLVAGNWKMHLTAEEAKKLAAQVVKAGLELPEAEIVLIPPFSLLAPVQKVISESPVQLGAQNMHWEDKGAFTGEISPVQLCDAGCRYVVLGHSERRQLFGETDAAVNKKIRAALRQHLTPIFCLGETLQEREQGRTMNRAAEQLEAGLEGLSGEQAGQAIIAYEPIWAIGTGKTATPGQAQEVHSFIRNRLKEKYGNEVSRCVIILYGGSVKPDNAFSLFREKDIDGFLVGGASLEAASFIQITKEAIKANKEKT
jgi:triosephosphate isomerase